MHIYIRLHMYIYLCISTQNYLSLLETETSSQVLKKTNITVISTKVPACVWLAIVYDFYIHIYRYIYIVYVYMYLYIYLCVYIRVRACTQVYLRNLTCTVGKKLTKYVIVKRKRERNPT